MLPADLEESARRTSALLRCRNIPDAVPARRGSGPCRCRAHADGRGDLAAHHFAEQANAGYRHPRIVSGALADRTPVPASEVAAAPRYAALSRRTDRQKLDAGTSDRGRFGPTPGAAFRSTFPPGATFGEETDKPRSTKKNNPRTHSAWSRFRLTLWALRVAVLGRGPWLVIRDQQNLERLCNSRRKRKLVGHELNRRISLFC